MLEKPSEPTETIKIEYDNAMKLFVHYSGLRRQDMAFVTTVQAAVLTIIGSKISDLDLTSFLLSVIAFIVLILGINSERRISAYSSGYMRRAKDIETSHNMLLLLEGRQEVRKQKLLFSNKVGFVLYYLVFIIIWIIIWIVNL